MNPWLKNYMYIIWKAAIVIMIPSSILVLILDKSFSWIFIPIALFIMATIFSIFAALRVKYINFYQRNNFEKKKYDSYYLGEEE